ncbi:inner membrane protein [Klebsiella pneumoniae]|uniref:Inner membrane protein n=2 Tax=Enterobacterales TaxID=91347 RepID=A0A377TNR7_KLEPN|nr:inner membrane protein [Klebsiella pneumoniae]
MAEFSFSKSLLGNKKRGALTGSHVAYGLFVLICCWAGAQMLSMLIHAPGVFERLMQAQDASRPQVDISLAVGTLFGLIPFLIGCTFIGYWRLSCAGVSAVNAAPYSLPAAHQPVSQTTPSSDFG